MRVLFRADARVQVLAPATGFDAELARALQNEGSDVRWCGRAPEVRFGRHLQMSSANSLEPGTENSKNAGGGIGCQQLRLKMPAFVRDN